MLLLFVAMVSFAQNRMISGAITDRDSKEPVEQTTVQLLKMDSSYVAGAISNEKGLFRLNAPENGKYLLKITSVGYKTTVKRIVIDQDKDLAMGNISIGADAIMLKAATVTAMAQKVTIKEDTFVYNSAAYRTPEGSVVEELVRRLPGAEVSDDGTIKINGKQVKKILVDGKEFMTGDTKTAMKNLPTSIIDKIKAYDEKSDLAKVTGIDDGEEQTVLDFGVKKGMNKGVMSNIDLGLGNKDRYSARGMAGYFNSNNRFMIFGNANNTADRGFPGGGPRMGFGGGNGLNAKKTVALNYNYENKDKLKFNTSLRWNHSDGDVWSSVASENYLGSSSSFSNRVSQSFSRSNSWNGNIRLEWMPDTMTNILFRPSFSWSTSDGLSSNRSAQFNDDPYQYVDDPLADAFAANFDSESSKSELQRLQKLVNNNSSSSLSYSSNNSINGMLQYNRKLNSKGRNLTLRADASYNKTDSKSISQSMADFYLTKTKDGLDSTYQTRRYNVTPSKKYSYSGQFTYSEPLWRATFLQFSYKFTYNYTRSDRSTYSFDGNGLGADSELTPDEISRWNALSPAYRSWGGYLGVLSNPLESYLDGDLSRYSEYSNYIHELQLMMRIIRQKYNLSFGVMMQPQRTKFVQDYLGIHTDTVRNVVNFAPTLDFRYKFSKMSRLRINYRGTTSQPSMTDLLNIRDDSNPLSITEGNPGLKPSFTNSLRADYNNSTLNHNMGYAVFGNFETTSNSISNKVTYNEETGGRVTRPENINGNWNAYVGGFFNTSIDSAGVWNVNTNLDLSYKNYMSYLDVNKVAEKNKTTALTWGQRLSLGYRNDWLEVTLDGTLTYTHGRNKLQPKSNADTWQFSYGPSFTLSAPWGTSLNTSLSNSSRRGFSDATMNTDELVWNAQISQSFLKGKPLTVMLQFYDLLHQQSTFSRAISATSRTDTQYNAINSYAMLHVVYRMNIFGGKNARQGGPDGGREGGRPDFGGKPFGGGRPPMGGSRGGRF